MKRPMKIGSMLLGLSVVFGASLPTATAQKASLPGGSGFSFDVYGDSRSMMFLPYKSDQEAEARQLMVDIFSLVLPEKVSAEMVDKHVKLTYDPVTNELMQITMPFDTASEVTTLKLDKGWVTEASVEDVKLLPGVQRTMFRLEGGEWVAREVVKDVKSGQATFVLSTGDLVWWGKQGNKPSDNPYWKLVNEDVLKQLPPPDKHIKKAGLHGHVSRCRQSRSVGGLRRGRSFERLSLLEKVRRLRQATHLQVRLRRGALHLPVDGQI
jgi:hypothetical protein